MQKQLSEIIARKNNEIDMAKALRKATNVASTAVEVAKQALGLGAIISNTRSALEANEGNAQARILDRRSKALDTEWEIIM